MSTEHPPHDDEGPRDFVHYAFFRLAPAWREGPETVRRTGRHELAAVLGRGAGSVRLRTYSLVGLKAGVDLLLWSIAERVEAIQELHAAVLGTRLGRHLVPTHAYLGMGRRSEYLGSAAHGTQEGGSGRRSSVGRPYLFVYPFTKKREWYGLPFEERRRIMGEHFRIGREFPNVVIHTGYSFGIDDTEFILSFEADSPAEFLDLVQKLRTTEASRYTALETPIFTCVAAPPARMLELADGAA
ncbi:MAG TPA: chlorite dismutase family protein [Thermoplasmata archaeon]|nr:chlorite dismutase family protein [Thermoplasmata archaeon]